MPDKIVSSERTKVLSECVNLLSTVLQSRGTVEATLTLFSLELGAKFGASVEMDKVRPTETEIRRPVQQEPNIGIA